MDPLVCATGHYRFIPFLDPTTLEEQFRIPSKNSSCRVCQIHLYDDPIIAVGDAASHCGVRVYDVSTKKEKFHVIDGLRKRRHDVYGLASVNLTHYGRRPSSSSNPLVVAGSRKGWFLVFNARTGRLVLSQPESFPKYCTFRMIAVPEWSNSEVFAGGGGTVHRYDISRGRVELGTYLADDVEDASRPLQVYALSAIPSRKLVVSRGACMTVKLFSRDECECETTLRLSKWPFSLHCVEDKHLILAGCTGALHLWDFRQTSECLMKIEGSEVLRDIDRIDENTFVSGSSRDVSLWDLQAGKLLRSMKMPGLVFGVRALGEEQGRSFKSWTVEDEERFEFLISHVGAICQICLLCGVSLKIWPSCL